MKYFYFFVEEESIVPVIKKVTQEICPKEAVQVKIFPHQGKKDLRHGLKHTVPTLSKMHNSRIIVLQDQDGKDCQLLKQELLDDLKNCHCPHKCKFPAVYQRNPISHLTNQFNHTLLKTIAEQNPWPHSI